MKILPNFLIVGSQKCGTTALHDILGRHPETNMSAIKEINFFTNERKYEQGLDYYSSFWEEKENCKITGEASPGYIVYPGAAEKIRSDLGRIKIVIILRDPIRRALSQYWDNRRHLSENETFNQTIEKYLTETYTPETKGYFSRGVYIKYIEKYWHLFGKDHVHIMTLENLVKNPQLELSSLYNFLGIITSTKYLALPEASNSSHIWNNPLYKFFLNHPHFTNMLPKRGRSLLFFGPKTSYKYPIPDKKIIRKLVDFYEPWNESLEKQTGLNLDSWTRQV